MLRVGGVTSRDSHYLNTTRGPAWIDLGAPALDWLLLAPLASGTFTRLQTGTSFSAPVVAGVAGLVLSADPTLRYAPCRLADRLLRNADENVGDLDAFFAAGRRLNALAAVDDVRAAPVRACP